MLKVSRKVGRGVAGTIGLVAACAPMSVDLEHHGAAGETNVSGTGGRSLGTGGTTPGSAGRGGSGGTGAASGGTGATGGTGAASGGTGATGGSPTTGSEAGQAADGDGNAAPSCGDGVLADVQNGHDLLPGYATPRDPRVATWLSEMSLSEQIAEMQGVNDGHDKNFSDLQRSLDVPLPDGNVLRGYKYRSGPRGVNLAPGQPDRTTDGNDFATAYPAPSIRGASWDLDLEWRIGEAIGDETTASNNDLLLGPGVDVLRHPYWGRAQDTYGEDTYHLGRMGSAFVAGVQQRIGACAQHFVQNTIESGRSFNQANLDEQTLREIYARPFEMLVQDGGVACVMAAYGRLNGVLTTENAHLLTDILKGSVKHGGFGFRGFVLSDWWATPGGQQMGDPSMATTAASALANSGLDVELPWTIDYGSLASAVPASVDPAVVAGAAARILEQKARFQSALTTDAVGLRPASSTLDAASIATNDEHLALAERAELESAVLLANGPEGSPVLPIATGTTSIAVIGAGVTFNLQSSKVPKSCGASADRTCTFQFATDVALGDRGTNAVNADPAASIGPFAGIQAAASTHGSPTVTRGSTAEDAAASDLIVVVVGLTPGDEGEEYTTAAGGDRLTLALPGSQAVLVFEVLDLMKPTIIVVESGSIVDLPWLTHANRNQATIWAGYGGMRGGAALGKLVFGDANFSGKLPIAWASDSALPPFKDGTMSYFVGYREYDRRIVQGEEPGLVFPFGHGLSYTTFAYSNFVVPCTEVTNGAVLDVTANVTNTGSVNGDEVAFLFVAGPSGSDEQRSVKELKSFARVSLAPGAAETVHLPLRIQDLRHWSQAQNGWVIDPGEYTVLVGPSAADGALRVAGTFSVPG